MFGDNAATQYLARELKTILFEVNVLFMKITIHENYANDRNQYDQVDAGRWLRWDLNINCAAGGHNGDGIVGCTCGRARFDHQLVTTIEHTQSNHS
jgi:hypothetical protein